MFTFHFLDTSIWPFALERSELELQEVEKCDGTGFVLRMTSMSFLYLLME